MASPAAALAPPSPSAIMLSEAFFSLQLHEIKGGWGGSEKGEEGGVVYFLAEKTDSFKGPLLSLLGQNQDTDVVFLFV